MYAMQVKKSETSSSGATTAAGCKSMSHLQAGVQKRDGKEGSSLVPIRELQIWRERRAGASSGIPLSCKRRCAAGE